MKRSIKAQRGLLEATIENLQLITRDEIFYDTFKPGVKYEALKSQFDV